MTRKWYAVYVGHVPGVYDEWLECQIEASYLRFIAQQGIQNQRRCKNYYIIPLLIIVIALISYVIV